MSDVGTIVARFNNWTIRYSGGALADVICPHNRAVEVINYWDYYLGTRANPDADQLARDLSDLVTEATEGDWLQHYCDGHVHVTVLKDGG